VRPRSEINDHDTDCMRMTEQSGFTNDHGSHVTQLRASK